MIDQLTIKSKNPFNKAKMVDIVRNSNAWVSAYNCSLINHVADTIA